MCEFLNCNSYKNVVVGVIRSWGLHLKNIRNCLAKILQNQSLLKCLVT